MLSNVDEPAISVITATKNAGHMINTLYESLKRQSFRRFEWVIIDGKSVDSTLASLTRFTLESPWVKFESAPDAGIYDAINKGICRSRGRYYVVAGADDSFEENALAKYFHITETSDGDVILADVLRNGKILGGFKPNRAWLGHSKAFKGSHSVGMLFRKNLHQTYGFYSKRFPLLADGFFLKILLNSRRVQFVQRSFTAGTFGDSGASSVNKLQTLVETWHIQMLTENNLALQTLLFICKIAARYPSVVQEMKSIRHSASTLMCAASREAKDK